MPTASFMPRMISKQPLRRPGITGSGSCEIPEQSRMEVDMRVYLVDLDGEMHDLRGQRSTKPLIHDADNSAGGRVQEDEPPWWWGSGSGNSGTGAGKFTAFAQVIPSLRPLRARARWAVVLRCAPRDLNSPCERLFDSTNRIP